MPVYDKCEACGKFVGISEWPFCPHGHGVFTQGPSPGSHSSEKSVVYVSAQEGGKVQYPGQKDAPMPERLRKRGYERVEISPSQMKQFEKRHGVMNELRHYDRNGKTD